MGLAFSARTLRSATVSWRAMEGLGAAGAWNAAVAARRVLRIASFMVSFMGEDGEENVC